MVQADLRGPSGFSSRSESKEACKGISGCLESVKFEWAFRGLNRSHRGLKGFKQAFGGLRAFKK